MTGRRPGYPGPRLVARITAQGRKNTSDFLAGYPTVKHCPFCGGEGAYEAPEGHADLLGETPCDPCRGTGQVPIDFDPSDPESSRC